MAVTVTTPATVRALVSLPQLYVDLGMQTSIGSDNLVLRALVDRASDAIEAECGRVFAREIVVETLHGSGGQLLGLSRKPIVTVTTVEEDAAAITDYSIEDAAAGILYRETGWPRGVTSGWDAIAYTSGYILPGQGGLRYEVTYTAGYLLPGQQPDDEDDLTPRLPFAVEQACAETVRAWYADTGVTVGTVSELSVDDVRVRYAAPAAVAGRSLPARALDLLRPYLRTPV